MQHLDTKAIDPLIRIAQRNHHTRHTGLDERFRAGGCFSMMRTRLQRDIGRGAARRLPRHLQGHRFRMGTAAILCPAPADNLTRLDDNAADRRIGRDPAQPAPRQAKRISHMPFVT